MLRLGFTYASLRFHSRFAHAYTFLIKLPRWPFALRPFGGARSAKAPPGCRGGTAFPRAALPSAPEMDLDSDSDSSKPDMRDDLDGSDRRCSSNAQGSSLGAGRMGMQVRSSSSEDGRSIVRGLVAWHSTLTAPRGLQLQDTSCAAAAG